jgi:hypothetical protein
MRLASSQELLQERQNGLHSAKRAKSNSDDGQPGKKTRQDTGTQAPNGSLPSELNPDGLQRKLPTLSPSSQPEFHGPNQDVGDIAHEFHPCDHICARIAQLIKDGSIESKQDSGK